MKKPRQHLHVYAFTLMELLVVVAIIIILMGLAFPAFQSVQNSAKKTQAKNDLVQIVTAVNAYYTEYGKYPIDPANTSAEVTYGNGTPNNDTLLDVLRSKSSSNATAALVTSLNPRQISFISPPEAKNTTAPQGGISLASGTMGQYFDPWGRTYRVRLDANYDDIVANPYSSNAGSTSLRAGVIAWSLGKDGAGGTGDRNAGTNKDDVISWQ